MVEGKRDAFTYKILKIIRNKNNCIIIRIQDFGQGGTRILGTKILSKLKRNEKKVQDLRFEKTIVFP